MSEGTNPGLEELLPDERELVLAIAAYDPSLRHLLGEHVEYYEEVLPTVFLEEVRQWANERFLSGEEPVVAGLLQLLESHYAEGEMPVQNLIGTGFIESMDSPGQPAASMQQLLGPRTALGYRQSNGLLDDASLRRFWIEFEQVPFRNCSFGVTAVDLDDALFLVNGLAPEFFRPKTPVARVIEDVDVRSLDPRQVLGNMGFPVWRGVWYPSTEPGRLADTQKDDVSDRRARDIGRR